MPIALLEAMSYGLPVLASDIPANHEVGLPEQDYFPAGNVEALATALARKVAEPLEQEKALARIRQVEQAYTWPSISRRTIAVYDAVAGKRGRKVRS
jgi:glycosyltransferase involved in cell wall biosynthesis